MAAETLPGGRVAERAAGPFGVVAAALAATAAGVGVASWGASQILIRPTKGLWRMHRPLRVVDVDRAGGRITLAGADAAAPGVWGLRWPGGYARVDAPPASVPADSDVPTVSRTFQCREGAPPARGAQVHWDPLVWPDRAEAVGLPVRMVALRGPVCELPAWLYPSGDGADWAIFVHGRKSRRAQAFRALVPMHARGWTCMTVSYRNDDWLPRSGVYGLGSTEWQDLEAAVAYARDHGARRIVLVGYSLGGAIVSMFLRSSPHAEAVVGLVLDSPVLDWEVVLRRLARQVGLPEIVASAAMAATTLRTGIDFTQLNHLARAGELLQPTLLFHGDRDEQVPVELSRAFAAARPDLVQYVEVPGAGHVVAWNHAPERYEAALHDFLDGFAVRRRRVRLPLSHPRGSGVHQRTQRRRPNTPPVAAG